MEWTLEAVRNILENALKYSPEGSEVRIEIVPNEAFTCIRIQDEGIGIREEEQGLVFERFYRSPDVRRSREWESAFIWPERLYPGREGISRSGPSMPKGPAFASTFPIFDGTPQECASAHSFSVRIVTFEKDLRKKHLLYYFQAPDGANIELWRYNMNILIAENLKKYYQMGENVVKALDGVSLSVRQGEFRRSWVSPEAANPRCFICWEDWIGRPAGR